MARKTNFKFMRRTNCTLIKFKMQFDHAKIVIIFQPFPLFYIKVNCSSCLISFLYAFTIHSFYKIVHTFHIIPYILFYNQKPFYFFLSTHLTQYKYEFLASAYLQNYFDILQNHKYTSFLSPYSIFLAKPVLLNFAHLLL